MCLRGKMPTACRPRCWLLFAGWLEGIKSSTIYLQKKIMYSFYPTRKTKEGTCVFKDVSDQNNLCVPVEPLTDESSVFYWDPDVRRDTDVKNYHPVDSSFPTPPSVFLTSLTNNDYWWRKRRGCVTHCIIQALTFDLLSRGFWDCKVGNGE